MHIWVLIGTIITVALYMFGIVPIEVATDYALFIFVSVIIGSIWTLFPKSKDDM